MLLKVETTLLAQLRAGGAIERFPQNPETIIVTINSLLPFATFFKICRPYVQLPLFFSVHNANSITASRSVQKLTQPPPKQNMRGVPPAQRMPHTPQPTHLRSPLCRVTLLSGVRLDHLQDHLLGNSEVNDLAVVVERLRRDRDHVQVWWGLVWMARVNGLCTEEVGGATSFRMPYSSPCTWVLRLDATIRRGAAGKSMPSRG